MSQDELVLKSFFEGLKKLKFESLKLHEHLNYDELFHVELDDKVHLKVVEVTSGHDRLWFEVSGAPPVRFNLKSLDKAFEEIQRKIEE